MAERGVVHGEAPTSRKLAKKLGTSSTQYVLGVDVGLQYPECGFPDNDAIFSEFDGLETGGSDANIDFTRSSWRSGRKLKRATSCR